jgi:hypothetical protein
MARPLVIHSSFGGVYNPAKAKNDKCGLGSEKPLLRLIAQAGRTKISVHLKMESE